MLHSSDASENTSGKIKATGRLGSLVARFASTNEEIQEALALRYQVFCDELHLGSEVNESSGHLDKDDWDKICDHLLVYETDVKGTSEEKLIATSRLMTSTTAKKHGKAFYSQSEFDVASLMGRHQKKTFLELGRTCVLPEWRSRRCVELLWHSIWAYALEQEVDVMTGCASFIGADPQAFADSLAYLFYNCTTDIEEWSVEAVSETKFLTNLKSSDQIDNRLAFRGLPPLIKGYLRLGAWVSKEAVIDEAFGTIDILIILPVSNLNPRHVAYYGEDASRYSEVSSG